jgi:hypothetical protein
VDDRAVSIVLAALRQEDRVRLLAALDVLVMRLELRRNPMVEDLEDDALEAALFAFVEDAAPALGAAWALASRRRVSGDGAMTITASDVCDDVSTHCIAAWSDRAATEYEAPVQAAEEPDDDRRARFLMWPVTAAAMLEFEDAAALATGRESLRTSAGSRDPAACIALVLSAQDLAESQTAQLVRSKARQAVDLMGGPRRAPKLLAVFAHEPKSADPFVPWLHLGPHELLVVPRLACVARIRAFVAEVETAVARVRTRTSWRHHPRQD